MNEDDLRYMRRAVALAASAAGLASPNPTVGCVIVRDGAVVGAGWHEYALVDHAEIAALRQAGKNAVGATVYSTLEPCSHHGRTPPCAERLAGERVGRVVIAMKDPNPKVAGSGIEILKRAGIPVDVGTMEAEAGELIEPFACHITTGLPLVVGKAGMSVDGRIAPVQRSAARWITSPEGRDFGQQLRLRMDAILVGVGTVLADDPELTYRGSLPKARPLVRVILDSRLRTPPSAKLLMTSKAPVLIFCSPQADASHRERLEKEGAEIVEVPRRPGGLDLLEGLGELGRRDILGVLVEGGSAVHGSFLAAGLVNKFMFVVSPLVLGTRAVPCIGGSYATLEEAPRFRFRRSLTVGPDIILEACPIHKK